MDISNGPRFFKSILMLVNNEIDKYEKDELMKF